MIPYPTGAHKKHDNWWVHRGHDIRHSIDGWTVYHRGVTVGEATTLDKALRLVERRREAA